MAACLFAAWTSPGRSMLAIDRSHDRFLLCYKSFGPLDSTWMFPYSGAVINIAYQFKPCFPNLHPRLITMDTQDCLESKPMLELAGGQRDWIHDREKEAPSCKGHTTHTIRPPVSTTRPSGQEE